MNKRTIHLTEQNEAEGKLTQTVNTVVTHTSHEMSTIWQEMLMIQEGEPL